MSESSNFRFCYNKLHRYPPFRNLQAFQKASSRTRIVVMTLTRRIIILLKSCSATLSEWLMNTRRHRGQWSWWVSLLGTGRWGFLPCLVLACTRRLLYQLTVSRSDFSRHLPLTTVVVSETLNEYTSCKQIRFAVWLIALQTDTRLSIWREGFSLFGACLYYWFACARFLAHAQFSIVCEPIVSRFRYCACK